MTSEERTELASLYALDALDDAEQSWVNDEFASLSDFQAEVAELAEIAAQMAYGVAPLPMAANLKARLFENINAASPAPLVVIANLLEKARTAKWTPYTLAPGAEVATLGLNSETRQVECLVRGVGSIQFPQHRHAADEEIVVLEGDLVVGNQIYAPGDRILSQPGTVHQPETLKGCIIYVRTSLDDEIFCRGSKEISENEFTQS